MPFLRLLVVDDDRLFVNMARRLCGPAVDIRVAVTARDALDVIASAEVYHAAIIDLLLPVEPRADPEPLGAEILLKLRRERPSVPVTFVTARTDDANLRAQVEAMEARFVAKPASGGNVLWPMYVAIAKAYGLDCFESDVFIEQAVAGELTSLEPDIVALAVLDVPRSAFAERLGTSDGNVRRYITRICSKMKSTEVLEIGASIRRDARSRRGSPSLP